MTTVFYGLLLLTLGLLLVNAGLARSARSRADDLDTWPPDEPIPYLLDEQTEEVDEP